MYDPHYINTFGLLEGEDVGERLQSSVNSTVLLFTYLYARDTARVKVHLFPCHPSTITI